jgi:hemerythrin superfamily protein
MVSLIAALAATNLRDCNMATKSGTEADRKTRRAAEDRAKRNERAAASSEKSRDALEMLEEDHRKVEELFDEYDEVERDNRRRGELAHEICDELTVHTQLEEEIFYPQAREATKDNELIDEAIAEHAAAKRLIEEIKEMEPGEDLFDTKIRVLEETVKRHIQEEEEELFPELTSAGMDTEAVGKQLARRKQELMAELPG